MATIGSLQIPVTATTQGLVAGLNRASGLVRGFSSGISASTGKVLGWGSALTAAVTGGGLAYLVKQSADGIDKTAKLADSLGDTTQGITGLQYAAGLAGADSETLDKGLNKMVVTLGEARGGSAQAAAAFGAIGLNFNELASMKPSEAFAAIADGIKALPGPADRAAAAMAIFGKNGLALLPTLAAGSGGIKDAAAEAEKLGITFNRVDTAKVEAANDSLAKVWQMVVGLGNQIAIQLAPFVTDLANRLIGVGTSGGGMASMVATAIDWIIKGIGFVADYGIRPLIIGFEAIGWVFLKSSSLIFKAVDMVGSKLVALINLIPGMNVEWTSAFDGMSQLADNAANSVGKSLSDNIFAPPPSDTINSYVKSVRDAAQKAAEAATGGIPLNQATAGNAPAALKTANKIELPKALIAGSSAAISFVNQQKLGGGDPQQQIVNLNKQQLTVQQQQLQAIRQLAANGGDSIVDF